MRYWKQAYIIVGLLILIGVVKISLPSTLGSQQVNDFIYTNCDVDDKELVTATNYVETLPSELLIYFTEDSWKICIVDDISGNVIGRTLPDTKEILIKQGYVTQALYHEFGHMYLMTHEIDDDFKEVYEEEAQVLLEKFYGNDDIDYYLNDMVEYYCQAFQTVRLASDKVAGVAPKTWSYFNEIFTQLYN